MAMFHLLKTRTSVDIFKNEKCKVTFGLEYSYKNPVRIWFTEYLDSKLAVFGKTKPRNEKTCRVCEVFYQI